MTPSEQAAIASAIAAAISAGAAVVSVIVAAVTVWLQIHSQRPRLTVSVRTAMPIITPVPGSRVQSTLGEPWVGIEIVNRGRITVSVRGAGLQLAGGQTIPHSPFDAAPGTPTLPLRLEPGEETTLYFKDIRALGRTVSEEGRARYAFNADRRRGRVQERGDQAGLARGLGDTYPVTHTSPPRDIPSPPGI